MDRERFLALWTLSLHYVDGEDPTVDKTKDLQVLANPRFDLAKILTVL